MGGNYLVEKEGGERGTRLLDTVVVPAVHRKKLGDST